MKPKRVREPTGENWNQWVWTNAVWPLMTFLVFFWVPLSIDFPKCQKQKSFDLFWGQNHFVRVFWWKRRRPKAGDVFTKTRLMPKSKNMFLGFRFKRFSFILKRVLSFQRFQGFRGFWRFEGFQSFRVFKVFRFSRKGKREGGPKKSKLSKGVKPHLFKRGGPKKAKMS